MGEKQTALRDIACMLCDAPHGHVVGLARVYTHVHVRTRHADAAYYRTSLPWHAIGLLTAPNINYNLSISVPETLPHAKNQVCDMYIHAWPSTSLMYMSLFFV